MNRLTQGTAVRHLSSGLLGRIEAVRNDGLWGIFRAQTNALFSGHANEFQPADCPVDPLDALMIAVRPSGSEQ